MEETLETQSDHDRFNIRQCHVFLKTNLDFIVHSQSCVHKPIGLIGT